MLIGSAPHQSEDCEAMSVAFEAKERAVSGAFDGCLKLWAGNPTFWKRSV